MSRVLNEHIVAILASTVNHRADASGIVDGFELEGKDLILGQRDQLETTTAFRQVLPVVIFTHKGLVWAYKRTKAGNEKGLHDQVSVAVGGHWDLEDIKTTFASDSVINVPASVAVALAREISEEIFLGDTQVIHKEYLCALAASVTEVDKKHIAMIYKYEVDLPEIDANEPDLESMGFVSPQKLLDQNEAGNIHLETWAKVACSSLVNNL